MKIKILLGMLFSFAVMNLTGCGGGGGGGAAPTVVSGAAAAGQFVSGTVNIFGVVPVTFVKGALLKTTQLDALGNYSADISPYTGPVLVEVAIGGKYKDEATGTQFTTTAPLRVAISNAAGNTSAMVTPLTEMAVLKMNNIFSTTAVDTSNANITAVFKLDDITKTKPVDATDATAMAATTTTVAQKNQSLVLAALSQLMKNTGGKLEDVLKGMSDDISGNIMADKSISGFKTALFDFMTDLTKNKTGITDTATATVNIGTFKIARLKISLAGLVAPAKIGVLDFTFNLPAGVTMTKDATTNVVSPGLVAATGVAAPLGSNSISLATLTGQALRTRLINAQGFGAGEFVGISCTVPTGATAPTIATFNQGLTAATFSEQTNELGAPITTVFTLSATKVDVF